MINVGLGMFNPFFSEVRYLQQTLIDISAIPIMLNGHAQPV